MECVFWLQAWENRERPAEEKWAERGLFPTRGFMPLAPLARPSVATGH